MFKFDCRAWIFVCVFLYPSNQKKIQTIPNQIFIQTILVIVKHLEEEHSTEVLYTIQTRAFHLDRFASLKENNTDRRRDTNIWARFFCLSGSYPVSPFFILLIMCLLSYWLCSHLLIGKIATLRCLNTALSNSSLTTVMDSRPAISRYYVLLHLSNAALKLIADAEESDFL